MSGNITSNMVDQPRIFLPSICVSRLFAALDLMELNINLMRQNLTRQMPGASNEEILERLQQWIESSPNSNSGKKGQSL